MSVKYKDPLCEAAFEDWFYENYGLDYNKSEKQAAKAAWEFAANAYRDKKAEKHSCAARHSTLAEPQDCDWPVCGCDPHATKVIEALQESGALRQPAEEVQKDAERWRRWLPWMRNLNKVPFDLAKEIADIDAALAAKDKP